MVTVACGGGTQTYAPARAVGSFYDAVRRHDAMAACHLLTPSVVREIERPTHQTGKPCVPALRRMFALVSASAFPRFFDDEPSVSALHVNGDRATVTVRTGKQTRSVGLRRIRGQWKISASPGFS
jgi:hypothetical protein